MIVQTQDKVRFAWRPPLDSLLSFKITPIQQDLCILLLFPFCTRQAGLYLYLTMWLLATFPWITSSTFKSIPLIRLAITWNSPTLKLRARGQRSSLWQHVGILNQNCAFYLSPPCFSTPTCLTWLIAAAYAAFVAPAFVCFVSLEVWFSFLIDVDSSVRKILPS